MRRLQKKLIPNRIDGRSHACLGGHENRVKVLTEVAEVLLGTELTPAILDVVEEASDLFNDFAAALAQECCSGAVELRKLGGESRLVLKHSLRETDRKKWGHEK